MYFVHKSLHCRNHSDIVYAVMRGTGLGSNLQAMKSGSFVPGRSGGVDDVDDGDDGDDETAVCESCRRSRDPRTWMTSRPRCYSRR